MFVIIAFLVVSLGLALVFLIKRNQTPQQKIPAPRKEPAWSQESSRISRQTAGHNLSPEDLWKTWNVGIHNRSGQITRQKRSWGCQIESLDREQGVAKVLGKTGQVYTTTLRKCTCPDFFKRNLPCKHMYRLSTEMGFTAPPRFSCNENDYTID